MTRPVASTARQGPSDEHFLEVTATGRALLSDPLLNKDTAFTLDERRALRLDGLLPPHVETQGAQLDRTRAQYGRLADDHGRYAFLRDLQDRNETLFFAFVERHLAETLPILYTPTVGDAARTFSSGYRAPRGVFVGTSNIDRVDDVLANVARPDVRMIVATDSSAILGIGDQGVGGLVIPIGKLAIYTACGGVDPRSTLPVVLDVGTNREELLGDPAYLGERHPRLTGDAYDAFLDRFVEAVRRRFPNAVVQWEDFSRGAAFDVLERARHAAPSFNDDVQGTGATALAGVLNACALKGERLEDQVFVVAGAGAGGIGVAWAITNGLTRRGLTRDEARRRVFVTNRRGLLVRGAPLEPYQEAYAQEPGVLANWTFDGTVPSLADVVRHARATVLLGLSGVRGLFSREVVEAAASHTPRPVVFALSNPTDHSEADPGDVARWTNGRAILATGSPFDDVPFEGRRLAVGQGNNAFVFPGLGLGAMLARAREVTDAMVLEAAYALSDATPRGEERVYPRVEALRAVSVHVAARVIAQAVRDGVHSNEALARLTLDETRAYVEAKSWRPRYRPYRLGQVP